MYKTENNEDDDTPIDFSKIKSFFTKEGKEAKKGAARTIGIVSIALGALSLMPFSLYGLPIAIFAMVLGYSAIKKGKPILANRGISRFIWGLFGVLVDKSSPANGTSFIILITTSPHFIYLPHINTNLASNRKP